MNCCLGIGKSSRTGRPARREDQKDVGLGGWLRRGEVDVRLRGDLAAFSRFSDEDGGSAGKVGLRRVGNGCSVDVMGSLDAGRETSLICY
jgi:hypothetical protein